MDVIDLASPRALVLHNHPHGRRLSFRMRPQAPDIQGVAFGVGQDEHACQPLDSLQRHRPLPIEFIASALASLQYFRIPGFGLCEASLRTSDPILYFVCGTTDLFVDPLQNLGQRQLNVFADALDFGQAFRTDLVDKKTPERSR